MYTIEGDRMDFFWDTERIFDLVSYKTGVQAKNMAQPKEPTEKGEMDYIVTDDDKEYVMETLRPVFVNLFEFFLDIAYPEPNVLYVGRPDAELGIFVSGFAVVCRRGIDGEVIVGEQRINSISSLCQEFLVAQVVSRWCDDNRLGEFQAENKAEMAEIERKLVKNISYLKKRGYVNSFS